MSRRKVFEYPIGDETLKFYERNKGDSDYIALADRYRASRFRFIQEHTKDPDDRAALLFKEMDKEYSVNVLSIFMISNKDMIREQIFDAYKLGSDLKHDKGSLFKVIEGHEENIFDMLLKIEGKDPETIKKKDELKTRSK